MESIFFFESYIWHFIGGLLASSSKQSACNRKTGVSSCVRKISWRRQWQPTPVFLLEEFHGQRSLVGFQIVGLQRVSCDSATNTHTSGFLQGSKTDLKAMAFLSVGSGNCQWGEEPQNHLCQPYSGHLDLCPPLPHNHGQKCGELKAGARSSMGHADTGRDKWSLMGTLLPRDCCGSEAAFETPTPLCWNGKGTHRPPRHRRQQGSSRPQWPQKAPDQIGRYRFRVFFFREDFKNMINMNGKQKVMKSSLIKNFKSCWVNTEDRKK